MPEIDPRATLDSLLARLAAAPRGRPSAVVVEILPLLADARIPAARRVEAAARVLRAVPDRPRPVLRVARAATVGLAPSRAVARLRAIQNQLVRSESLDALIEARAKRVRLACPRCAVRLSRGEMVKHLWHSHGLVLDGGKTRPAEAGDPAAGNPDAVAEAAGAAGLRQWIARREPSPEDTATLTRLAAGRGAGLCPGCFAELEVAAAPLPPPLTIAHGRLAGDGYAVAVGGNAWVRRLAVTTPHHPTATVRRSLAPRAAATLATALVLVATAVLAPKFAWSLFGLAAAALLYFTVRLARTWGTPDDLLIEAAWRHLVPLAAERDGAARVLTRLCLTSLGRGDPETRAKALIVLEARSAARADDSDGELQLLAAVSVLQTEDAAQYGRDAVAGVADLAAQGLRGEHPADFAESVAGAYLARRRDPGDLARLRVLLVAAAFEAGLVPCDIRDLWAAAPNLRRVTAVDPPHRLGLLFGLWRSRAAKNWNGVGEARTVFDLARRSPRASAELLARQPDLLLVHHPPAAIEALTGPVLVCARGVVLGGAVVADPDADVRVVARGRELAFGRHRIPLAGVLPAEFATVLKAWLRYRAEVLLPFIDGYMAGGSKDVSRRVLAPFSRKCRNCGTVSAVARGAVGRATE